MKKSIKHRAIAPAALGGCGGLGQLWEALAELWEALGELWEGLYFEKLPINRPSGRYVIFCLTCSWTSLLKHLLLRAFLAGNLPKKLSKLGVLDERGMKK